MSKSGSGLDFGEVVGVPGGGPGAPAGGTKTPNELTEEANKKAKQNQKKSKKSAEYDDLEKQLPQEPRYDYEHTHTTTVVPSKAATSQAGGAGGGATSFATGQAGMGGGGKGTGYTHVYSEGGRMYRYSQFEDNENARPSRFLPPGQGEEDDYYGDEVPSLGAVFPGVYGLGYGYDYVESKAAREFLGNETETFFAVDRIGPLPLTVACTKVTVTFVDPDGMGFAEVSQVQSIHSIQNLQSLSAFPEFKNAHVTNKLRPKTVALITVEAVDRRSETVGVLGHLVVPLYNKRGAFESRLKERHWEEYRIANAPPLPLTSVRYRVNEPTIPSMYLKMFELSDSEKLIAEDRPLSEKTTPQQLNLAHPGIDKVFKEGERSEVDLTTYIPFNEARGVAVVVHQLQSVQIAATTAEGILAAQAGAFIFKISASVLGDNEYTKDHDWASDFKNPGYNDEVLKFEKIESQPIMHVIFQVYVMKLAAAIPPGAIDDEVEEAKWSVNAFAWGVVRLLDEEGFLCHYPGKSVQLFYGKVPQDVLHDLEEAPCEEVIEGKLSAGKIRPVPDGSGRLIVALGDPAREEALVAGAESKYPRPPIQKSLHDAFCGVERNYSIIPLHRSANKAFEKFMIPAEKSR